MEVFCKKIKELRLENRYTQKQLAALLNVSNSTVCDWETGRSEPDLKTLTDIASLFGISTDYLLGLEE